MPPVLVGPRGACGAPCSDPALAAGGAQEAGVGQGEGFAHQQRLALQAGKVLLVPGQPFHLLVVLREDDLWDRQTDRQLLISTITPSWRVAGAGRTSPILPTKPISCGGQALGMGT